MLAEMSDDQRGTRGKVRLEMGVGPGHRDRSLSDGEVLRPGMLIARRTDGFLLDVRDDHKNSGDLGLWSS